MEKSRLCYVSVCDRKHHAKGLCKAHYDRQRKHGEEADLESPVQNYVKRAKTDEEFMEDVTTMDLFWTAGLLEGDGYFAPTTAVRCNMVDTEPLEKLHSLFGGSLRPKSMSNSSNNARPQTTWTLCGNHARELMFLLYPIMSERRKEQIKKAM